DAGSAAAIHAAAAIQTVGSRNVGVVGVGAVAVERYAEDVGIRITVEPIAEGAIGNEEVARIAVDATRRRQSRPPGPRHLASGTEHADRDVGLVSGVYQTARVDDHDGRVAAVRGTGSRERLVACAIAVLEVTFE